MDKKEKAKNAIRKTATFINENWRDVFTITAIALIVEDLDDVADIAEIINP